MLSRRARIGSLIDLLYDAALGAVPWTEPLEALAALHSASSAMAGIERADGQGWGRWVRTDPDYNALFFQHYGGRHPYAQAMRSMPLGSAFADWMVMPKQAFYRTEFYNDWARPQEKDAAMAVVTLRDSEGLGSVVVTRSRRAGEFEAQDVALQQHLSPHLRRAFAAHLRLGTAVAERRAALGALDTLGHAVFGLDAAGRLRFANRAGEVLLGRRDGLLVERDGVLRAARPADRTALRRLLAAAGTAAGESGGGGALRLARPDGRPPLLVMLLPVSAAAADFCGLARTAMLLLVADPEEAGSAAEAAVLRALFGLTATEAAVARRVARGEGLPAVAAGLGVAHSTVRSHLNSVFAKTSIRRQSELAWLVARLGA